MKLVLSQNVLRSFTATHAAKAGGERRLRARSSFRQSVSLQNGWFGQRDLQAASTEYSATIGGVGPAVAKAMTLLDAFAMKSRLADRRSPRRRRAPRRPEPASRRAMSPTGAGAGPKPSACAAAALRVVAVAPRRRRQVAAMKSGCWRWSLPSTHVRGDSAPDRSLAVQLVAERADRIAGELVRTVRSTRKPARPSSLTGTTKSMAHVVCRLLSRCRRAPHSNPNPPQVRQL